MYLLRVPIFPLLRVPIFPPNPDATWSLLTAPQAKILAFIQAGFLLAVLLGGERQR